MITFSGAMTITPPSGLKLSGTTDLVAPAGVVLQTNAVGLSNTAAAGQAALTFLDGYIHDGAGFTVGGPFTLERTRMARCTPSCLVLPALGTPRIVVRQSEVTDVAGAAFDIVSCDPAAGLDVQSTVFIRNSTAIQLGSSCPATTIRNSTFRANGTGVSYGGGAGHVLRNNIFTSQTASAASCGSATFVNRDYHQLFGNASNGCVAADPNTIASDPLYVLPASDDLRLQSTSPAKDTGIDLGFDLNGPAPGNFIGAAPDRGGRETW